MTLKEALEKKATLAKRIVEMADSFDENDQEWKDATEEQNWTQLNADYAANEEVIAKHEAARTVAAQKAAAESALNPSSGGGSTGSAGRGTSAQSVEEQRELVLHAYLRNQMGENLSEAEQQAVQETGFNLNAKALEFSLLDTRAHQDLQHRFASIHENARRGIFNAPLETTTATLGGNIIPPETMLRQVEVNMLAFGGILQAADTITTSTGEPLSWPTADDTGNKGRIIAQNASHDDNAGGGSAGDGGPNPSFGKVIWNSYDYTSDTILVPFRLLRDNIAALPSMLGEMIGERLGRILSEHCTTGTGTGQPSGIVTDAALGVTAASATAIATDEVYELQHQVDPAYRNGAAFMCHDTVALHLRKKKDSEGRYLWQSGFNTGVPDTLAGSRLVYNLDMASAIATGNKTLLYGQLSKYKVRRVATIRFYRLTERYRDKDQDGFVAMMSADGGLLNAGTNPVKYLQQA